MSFFPLRPAAFRLLALSASLAVGTTSIANADDSASPQPRPTPAQADADLAAANARADQARTAADAAKTRLSDISSRLDADRLRAKETRQRMLDGESGLRELQAAADAASARLDARRQEIAAEGARFAPVRDAYEEAKLDAIREFNESPEYRAAVDAVNSAAANLHTEQSESDRELSMSRLTTAKAALDDLRRRFTDALPQNPRVVAAERPLRLEQAQYDGLIAAAAAAEQQLTDAQAALKRQNDGLAADRVGLDELTAEISKCEAELPGAQADSDQANVELESAVAYANSTRQARDTIYAAVVQPVTPAPAVLYQSSPYAYYPPGVVYVQPGAVYVRSPYYGNAYVQPRVYTYAPGAGHYYSSRVSGGHHGGHR